MRHDGGSEPLMKSEQAYLKLLQECDSYSVKDSKLVLSLGDQEMLEYEQAEAVQLPGTKWVVTAYNNGKEAVVSLERSPSRPRFRYRRERQPHLWCQHVQRRVHGDRHHSEHRSARVDPDGGSRESHGPEAAYVQALQNSTKWSVVRGMLEMRDANDALQVSASPQP